MTNSKTSKKVKPRAITMWDFSWLERRWPGAGYEDWDKVLDELTERGYDAVRIDAYPHLVSENPEKEWTLLPVWDQQRWGSPAINKVMVQPSLNKFIAKCKERDIKVALSSWFREDVDRTFMKITGPEKMAEIWEKTIESIAKDQLLDAILYIDLCNEWPGDLWAPFFKNNPPEYTWGYWHTDTSMSYMRKSIELLRERYPDLPFCYSFDGERYDYYIEKDLSFFDLLEHHLWTVKLNRNEFYKAIDYKDGRFNPQAYKNVQERAEKLYREKPEYWNGELVKAIDHLGLIAKKAKQPLVTTECWGIVDYKDWPLLSWDWVKEICELGTKTAIETGQWAAIATSNFCGPQFVGMWKDVEWHQKLTHLIKNAEINSLVQGSKLIDRL